MLQPMCNPITIKTTELKNTNINSYHFRQGIDYTALNSGQRIPLKLTINTKWDYLMTFLFAEKSLNYCLCNIVSKG